MLVRYTSAQVALLIKFAVFLDPSFGRKVNLSPVQLRLMSIGRMRPTASVLKRFRLQKQEGGFAWVAE